MKWGEELHTLSYVINTKFVKKITTSVVYFLTWFLSSKFDCDVSVLYLLSFIRRCVCMKEIKHDTSTAPSPLRRFLILCETIQNAVTLGDRQPGLSYGRFSTSLACIVFSDLQRLKRPLESVLCLYKNRIPLAQ